MASHFVVLVELKQAIVVNVFIVKVQITTTQDHHRVSTCNGYLLFAARKLAKSQTSSKSISQTFPNDEQAYSAPCARCKHLHYRRMSTSKTHLLMTSRRKHEMAVEPTIELQH